MKPTLEQERVLDDWMRQKVEHHICSLCQGTKWKVGELLMPVDQDPAGTRFPGTMVQVICQNCAHVLLFDVNSIRQWQAVDIAHPDLM
jgi:hypothetical protein